ncbi:F-box/kelch-repeat protein At4g38940-like [Brassica napus]|uniref:F-box/kelch-repeat protein At4g38940-like n=1 Tax=Brassica napus TaxID=3708 RepID=UPI0020791EA5|nr:F-box/kelch-repeat protein At4g38940-like [Brassica napus]
MTINSLPEDIIIDYRTEYCLYVTISKYDINNDGDVHRLYTLRQNFNSPDKKYSLVPVTSLPRLPPNASYVTADSKIFVIPDDKSLASTDTLLIDCRFHTAHHLPSMPNEVGEISIEGYYKEVSDGVAMFLNQIPRTLVCMYEWTYKSDHKLYMVTLKTDILNLKAWHHDNKCFLDGVSYFSDPQAVDVRQICVEDVKGVRLITDEDANVSCTVIYGEKVVVFLQIEICQKNEIWCVEIKVEKDQKGELCGRVEWCGCLLEGHWAAGPDLKDALVVKV